MTAFLRLNGLTVPVSIGTANADEESIGKFRRSVNATGIVPRRAIKGAWKFSTTIKSAAESLAWRDLIGGKGHVLSFDAQNYYTSKGMAPVSVAGGWSFTTSGPKYGAACAQWTTGNALWAFFLSGAPWTIGYDLNLGGGGWHRVWTNSAGNTWVDGVLGGSPPVGWSSLLEGFGGVASGVATFGSASASKIDNITALPFLAPDNWAAQDAAFGAAFGLLPALTADGAFVEQNTKVSVLGGDTPIGRVVISGSSKNLHSFAFDLFEI